MLPNKRLGLNSKQSESEQIRKLLILCVLIIPFPMLTRLQTGGYKCQGAEAHGLCHHLHYKRQAGNSEEAPHSACEEHSVCPTSPALVLTKVETSPVRSRLLWCKLILLWIPASASGKKCHLKKETEVQKHVRWLCRFATIGERISASLVSREATTLGVNVLQTPERATHRVLHGSFCASA